MPTHAQRSIPIPIQNSWAWMGMGMGNPMLGLCLQDNKLVLSIETSHQILHAHRTISSYRMDERPIRVPKLESVEGIMHEYN